MNTAKGKRARRHLQNKPLNKTPCNVQPLVSLFFHLHPTTKGRQWSDSLFVMKRSGSTKQGRNEENKTWRWSEEWAAVFVSFNWTKHKEEKRMHGFVHIKFKQSTLHSQGYTRYGYFQVSFLSRLRFTIMSERSETKDAAIIPRQSYWWVVSFHLI